MNWLQGTPRTVKPRPAYRSCNRSRPEYWGVRPHLEATLTTRTALPRYWSRSAEPPRRPSISTSKTDMRPILGDHSPRPAVPSMMSLSLSDGVEPGRSRGPGDGRGPASRRVDSAGCAQGVDESGEL